MAQIEVRDSDLITAYIEEFSIRQCVNELVMYHGVNEILREIDFDSIKEFVSGETASSFTDDVENFILNDATQEQKAQLLWSLLKC